MEQKKDKFNSDLSELETWYSAFYRMHGGTKPRNMANFLRDVDAAHQGVHELFGGNREIQGIFSGVNVILSSSCQAFLRIGTYGPDNYSCFRQGNFNQDKRYVFALQERTFVLVCYDLAGNCLCRGLCFMDHTYSVINICGLFFKEDANAIIIQKAFYEMARKVFKTETVGYAKDMIKSFGGGGLYTHAPYWSFFNREKINNLGFQCFEAVPRTY